MLDDRGGGVKLSRLQADHGPVGCLYYNNLSCLKCEEREKNQQDATIRCLLLTSVSTCFGHHYAHLQENKDHVLLHLVCCSGSVGCRW